ncbi:hypothetical protein [Nocardia sp. alder85J]|uniref:hypothetical protein n=1 Tax=Nocardia sp. alder85J TaxID=2862949 RepID=UPI001CD321A3|nr:hypothetical protein [Nocardia sp. alder85J]MCX4092215.1 hypothetical protein [Nocardia sp. alder85J]
MTDSLRIDEGEVQAALARLLQLAQDGAQAVSALHYRLEAAGRPWGDDETGDQFAKTYVPAADRGLDSIRTLMSGLDSLGNTAAQAVRALSDQDAAAAHAVAAAGSPNGTAAGPGVVPTVGAAPAPAALATPAVGTGAAAAAGGSTLAPTGNSTAPAATTTSATPWTSSAADGAAGHQGAQSQPGSPSQQPQQTPRQSAGEQPGTRQPQAGGASGRGSTTAAPAASGSATPAAAAQANSSRDGAAAGPARISAPAGTRDAPAGQSGPGARNTANTPWSKAEPAPSRTEQPPRVTPPKRKDRPPHAGRSAAPESESKRKRPSGPAAPKRDEPNPEALWLIREMSNRHQLLVEGFETSAIEPDTAQHLVDAVDLLAPRYPGVLHGIAVAGRSGPYARVEQRDPQDDHATRWLVLDPAAVADPRLLLRDIGAQAAAPMYVTVVRQFGRALELAGGGRARREAQRTLLLEFLHGTGASRDSLSRLVTDYRRWRSALGDECFTAGVFDPDAALANSFAAVELDGPERAHPAVRALHRLLTTVAERPPTGGSRPLPWRRREPLQAPG